MDTAPDTTSAKHQPAPVYQITVRLPHGADAIRLLRAALKVLLRRFGLRCVRVERVQP
jgi:hypothetical protein